MIIIMIHKKKKKNNNNNNQGVFLELIVAAKKKIEKYFQGKQGNDFFFNLKEVSLNSDENWPSYKSLAIIRGIIMILNNNNQGVAIPRAACRS